MSWRPLLPIVLTLMALATVKARADECRNPDAVGTGRVIAVNPHDFARVGTVQYFHTLPLADREVVLTFDDGPLPPYSTRILDTLAEQCAKATYFLVGRMARGYPNVVRRMYAEGHTIGSHSENHLLGFDTAPFEVVKSEVEQGIASVGAALGNRQSVAPFFRIPGFLRRAEVETYLQARGLATWSADVVADDWRHITAAEVVRRAIARLDEKRKGILLLHDIQPATALALPELLRELKAKGYRIVHVVPDRGSPPPLAIKAPVPEVSARAEPTSALPAISSPANARMPATPQVAAAVAAVPAAAAGSLARADDVPLDPVRPFTSAAKPARNMPTPGKFVTTEPGAWPPVVSVPVPQAGGIGVSPVGRPGRIPNGRFE